MTTRRAQRTAQLARVGARTGTNFVEMKARGALASDERREELRAEFELRSARSSARFPSAALSWLTCVCCGGLHDT